MQYLHFFELNDNLIYYQSHKMQKYNDKVEALKLLH